jgi:hypothetical protein
MGTFTVVVFLDLLQSETNTSARGGLLDLKTFENFKENDIWTSIGN